MEEKEKERLDAIYNDDMEYEGELDIGEDEREVRFKNRGNNLNYSGNTDLYVIHENIDDEVDASGSKKSSPPQNQQSRSSGKTKKQDSIDKSPSKKDMLPKNPNRPPSIKRDEEPKKP